MTLLIPNVIINKLAKIAEATGIRVTRHDLLMALVHEVCPRYCRAKPHTEFHLQAALPGTEQTKGSLTIPQFSFVMNMSKLLRHAPVLHNPWVIISIPRFTLPHTQKTQAIIQVAKHIRSTISDARRPQAIRQIIDQHKKARSKPMRPRHFASPEPNIILSSWTDLPLFDLEFPTGLKGRTIKPTYMQCTANVVPINLGGLMWEDGIFTWSSHEGFWMQGNLDERIWERLEDCRQSFYQGSG